MVLKGKSINQDTVMSLESYVGEDFITSKIPLVNFTKDLSGVGYDEVVTLIASKMDEVKSNVKVNTVADLNNKFGFIKSETLSLSYKLENSNNTDIIKFFTDEKYKHMICKETGKVVEIGELGLYNFIFEYSPISETAFNKSKFEKIFQLGSEYREEGDNLFKPLHFLRYLSELQESEQPFFKDILTGEIPYIELNKELKVKDLYNVIINKEKVVKGLTELREVCLKFVWSGQYNDQRNLLDAGITAFDNIIGLLSIEANQDKKTIFSSLF